MDWTQTLALVGLGFFWIHTLLMAAHATQEGRALARRAKAWKRGGLVRGQVETGGSGDGPLAVHVVEQVGRSKGNRKIHFHDRAYRSDVAGGIVRLDDGRRLKIAASSAAEVWTDPTQTRARADLCSNEDFAHAYLAAKKARGFARRLESPIAPGDTVWLYGLTPPQQPLAPSDVRESESFVGVSVAPANTPVIANFDPRPWLTARARYAYFAAAGFIGLSASVTAPMMWPAGLRWDLQSKVAAVAAIACFNLLQLFLKQIRDGSRVPAIGHVRGVWTQPQA